MTEDRLDGSRHLDPANDGAPVGIFAMNMNRTVRVVVADDAAGTVGGQQAAWMAVNMLARITGIVGSIDVVAPDVTVHADVDLHELPGAPTSLARLLQATVTAVAGTAMASGDVMSGTVDVALVIGDGDPGPTRNVVYVTARRWAAWVGSGPPRSPFDDEHSPVGAYIAAALGVAEVFKHAAGLLRKGEFYNDFSMSAWSRHVVHGPIDGLDDIGPAEFDTNLGDIHLAGAGAVAQAFVALLRVAHARGRAVIVDHDPIDDTNLNRYLLAVLTQIGEFKAGIAAHHLEAAGMIAIAVPHRWSHYVAGAGDELLPEDLLSARVDQRYDTVFSFVDKNAARHSVQNSWPRRLLGASTPGMALQVHDYAISEGAECLKCRNPLPRGATLEDVVEYLAGLPLEQRLVEGAALGLAPDVLEHLDDVNCAQLDAIDLAKFNGDRHAFAISFVTGLSGFLAAATAIRAGTGPFTPSGGFHSAYYSTLRPVLTLRTSQPIEGCDCGGQGGALHSSLWAT